MVCCCYCLSTKEERQLNRGVEGVSESGSEQSEERREEETRDE